MLVKAVVWRESRFDPKKQGSHGERGLMQVTERSGQRVGARKQDRRFQSGSTFRTKDKSGGRHLVFASRHGDTGTISPIQLLSLWRSTTPAPVVPSVGAVETALPRYRNTSFFKRSIFPQRVDTSSRLSTATNSISVAAGCDEDSVQMIRVGRVPFFDLCSKNVQLELATFV